MDNNTLYEVRSYAKDNGKLHYWGSSYSREEAENKMRNRFEAPEQVEWAEKYHRDWHIAEIDVTDAFKIPSEPKPRDLYRLDVEKVPQGEGHWNYNKCTVVEIATGKTVAEWTYKYGGRPPFEPFRQGDRMFALMSEHYTATSVIDLGTGGVIASEPTESFGFCPVGFYVPDWWDIHDGSLKPGSHYWSPRHEEPSGQYGFVWGCVWGDDSSWKVQYLDLSRIQEGIISRDDRFGYVELATMTDDPSDFIHVGDPSEGGYVTFAEQRRYYLDSGKSLSDE